MSCFLLLETYHSFYFDARTNFLACASDLDLVVKYELLKTLMVLKLEYPMTDIEHRWVMYEM